MVTQDRDKRARHTCDEVHVVDGAKHCLSDSRTRREGLVKRHLLDRLIVLPDLARRLKQSLRVERELIQTLIEPEGA